MNKKLIKILAITLCLSLAFGISSFALAENQTDVTTEEQVSTEKPNGKNTTEKPDGTAPGNKNVAGGKKFTDVAPDSWYAEYVNFVSKRGIMNGKDGTFRPTETTTRAEYVQALYNAAGAPEISENSSFTDVSTDAEYAKAVAWAEVNGIASGTGDGTFMPDGSLTREMAMTFLYRALSALNITADIPTDSVISGFSDNASVSSWALDAMNTLVNMGVISGTDEGKLNPQGSLVNAEVATMIYRVLGGDKKPGGPTANKEDKTEMTDEDKAAKLEERKADLAAKLANGQITQEEYDEKMAKLEEGNSTPKGKGEKPTELPEESTDILE